MKIARVAVLGVALGAGVVAALLALNLRAPSKPAAAVVKSRNAQVLVAAKDIPMGSKLAAGDVTWQDWPQTGISPNLIQRNSTAAPAPDTAGAIARASFFAGEPITESKLIRSDRGFMSAILPAGKRAVATKISADTSAGGFILPNDRVDVIMTRKAADDQYLTETILNDVRILAIDQTIEDVNGEKVVVGQTATLELSPQQVEILTVAQQMSDRLTLALRSIRDAETGPFGADAVHLIGGTKEHGSVTLVKNGVAREVNSTAKQVADLPKDLTGIK